MTGEPLGSFDPVVEVLRAAADALAVDLAVWEARDPGAPSPGGEAGPPVCGRHGGRGDHHPVRPAGSPGR